MTRHLRLVWDHDGYERVLADKERNRDEALRRYVAADDRREAVETAAMFFICFAIVVLTAWVLS